MTILISIVSLVAYFITQYYTQQILQQDNRATQLISDVNDFSVVINSFVLDPTSDANIRWLEQYEKVVKDLQFLSAYQSIEDAIIIDGITQLLNEIRQTFSSMVLYNRHGLEINSGYLQFDPDVAVSYMQLISKRLIKEIADLKLRYNLELQQALASQRFILLGIIIVLILVGVFTGLYFSRTISSRLSGLSNALKGVTEKRYPRSLPVVDSRDEIGFLSKTIEYMLAKISDYQKNLEKKISQRTFELNQAKALDDAIIESLGDGVVLLDIHYSVVLANDAALNILGIQRKSLIGKNWLKKYQLFSQEYVALDQEKRPESIAFKGTEKVTTIGVQDRLYFKIRPKEYKPVAITASRVQFKDSLFGLVVLFRDITQELAMDMAKTEFVSLASHQLRTPISAINWTAELLLGKDYSLSHEVRDFVRNIYDSNHRMISIVNTLLNVARIDMGTLHISPQKNVDVVHLINKVVDAHTTASKEVSIVTEISKDIGPLTIDPNIYDICFDNLLSNAIKYSPPNSKIIVRAYVTEKNSLVGEKTINRKGLVFEVEDHGFGIPEADRDKIYDKLFRAHNILERDTDGTGIGLYLVKSIMDNLNGDIWFSSQENKGTTFYLFFPLSTKKTVQVKKDA